MWSSLTSALGHRQSPRLGGAVRPGGGFGSRGSGGASTVAMWSSRIPTTACYRIAALPANREEERQEHSRAGSTGLVGGATDGRLGPSQHQTQGRVTERRSPTGRADCPAGSMRHYWRRWSNRTFFLVNGDSRTVAGMSRDLRKALGPERGVNRGLHECYSARKFGSVANLVQSCGFLTPECQQR